DTAHQLTTIVTPLPISDPPPELVADEDEFQRLRARFGHPRLPRAQARGPHGRLAGIRVARRDDSRRASRRRGVDESGIWRGLRVDRAPHPRSLPWRAGIRLDRRVPEAADATCRGDGRGPTERGRVTRCGIEAVAA